MERWREGEMEGGRCNGRRERKREMRVGELKHSGGGVCGAIREGNNSEEKHLKNKQKERERRERRTEEKDGEWPTSWEKAVFYSVRGLML